MTESAVIIEFRRMLDELDAAFPDSLDDHVADRHYADLRDGVLVYIDEHPEVRDEARAAGLPVD
jgi:hypothetical protein